MDRFSRSWFWRFWALLTVLAVFYLAHALSGTASHPFTQDAYGIVVPPTVQDEWIITYSEKGDEVYFWKFDTKTYEKVELKKKYKFTY